MNRSFRYKSLRPMPDFMCTIFRLLLSGVVLLVLWGADTQSLRAQIDTGSISGTVTDSQGAVVPDASVQIRDEQTGYTDSQLSRKDGVYSFPSLKIGKYAVRVRANGFAEVLSEHILIQVQSRIVIDFPLRLAATDSAVEVTDGQSTLQTTSASVSQTIGTDQINSLPLNGRNFALLAQLSPGTTTTVNDNGHGGLANGTFTANGMIATFNNYILDGVSNNNPSYGGTSYAVKPPPDGLSEFRLETANYSAEYGRSGGAVLNAATRSGQSRFYGDIWEYNRNSFFDANDYFLKLADKPKPDYSRNQYGFSLGGPIYHNRTFFFGDYEGMRIKQGQAFTSTVPTLQERTSGFTNYSELIGQQTGTQTDILGRSTPVGTIFDPATTRYLSTGYLDPMTGLSAQSTGYVREPFAGNTIPADRLSSVAAKLLALYPAPNAGDGTIVNNYVSAPYYIQATDGFDVRVDQNFSDRDQFFARASYSYSTYTIPTPCPGLAECGTTASVGTNTTNVEAFVIGETHIFSSNMVNDVRIGYNREHSNSLAPFGSTAGLNAENGIPGIPDIAGNGGLAQIKITGLSELGSHNNIPSDDIASEAEYNDNLSYIRGKHSLRFGGQFERMKQSLKSAQYPHGNFGFSGGYTDLPNGNTASTGIAQFVIEPRSSLAAGCIVLPSTAAPPGAGCYSYDFVGGSNQIQASPLSQEDYRKPYFGTYITDNWRVRPWLTFDLGLRYEFFSNGPDHYGNGANFVPSGFSKDGRSEYLIDDRARGIALSPSFVSLLASQNIDLIYTSNHSLADVNEKNFGPRIGVVALLAKNLVLRAGWGIFYAGIYARGDGYNIGNNYPFSFAVNVTSNTAAGLSGDGSVGPIDKGLANVPLTAASVVGSQISPRGMQYFRHVPNAQNANLTLQYQITSRQYMQLAYVGTQSRHIESQIGSNRPSVLLPPVLPAGTTLANYLPYPGLPTNGYYMVNEGSNNYNSLQAQYEKLISGGVSLLANYTWSRFLGYGSDSNSFQSLTYRAPYVKGFGMQGEYGNMDFESENVLHVSGGWQLPFGKNRRWLNRNSVLSQALGGWNMNGILTYQSGQPVTVNCSVTTDSSAGCYALANKSQLYTGARNVNHWFNAAAFSNPPVATAVGQTDLSPLGARPGQGFGPAFHRGDLGIQKIFSLWRSHELELRAEAFNLTNTPNFAQPGTLTPNSTSFASITGTRDNPSDAREFQFAIKYLFGGGHQE